MFMIVVASTTSGQEKPDFTGTWTQIDPPPSSGVSRSRQIEQHGNVLKVRSQESGDGLLGWGRGDDRSYTIGGPVESRRDTEGRVRTVAVTWEGPTLIFTRTSTDGANTTTEREVWSLAHELNDGRRQQSERRRVLRQGNRFWACQSS
jgi:hypothetical protein